MKSIGFIPLRKGSKGIVNKNKRRLLGRPLFTWVLGEAIQSQLDEIFVFTDDESIISYVNSEYQYTKKVRAILRGDENAQDESTTESAILEFTEMINYDFDTLCLLQATSPFTKTEDIDNGIRKLGEGLDSVLSVVNLKRFAWDKTGNPLNYSLNMRPRRQDFEGLLMENGAIYLTTRANFHRNKNRLGGKIGMIEMRENSFHELDSLSDWIVAENLIVQEAKMNKKCKKITHLVLDVDGVFTDGTVSFTHTGEHTKQFDMRDGMGLELLKEEGVEIIVITSENSELVQERMKKLSINKVHLGIRDKYTYLKGLLNNEGVLFDNVAYVGDDINDLFSMCCSAWSFAPKNATRLIKNHADILLDNISGHGAIREVIEFIVDYNKRFIEC
ncbi:acylneuraminate cytidylyltransferase [Flavobacteriaceae bacterium]|nr:acylneuraminate cytidylyltransferase [Flavobacteriaceae bacterium]